MEIDDSGIYVKPYQCNNYWYLDQPGQENYFLLMTSKESIRFAADNFLSGNYKLDARPPEKTDGAEAQP